MTEQDKVLLIECDQRSKSNPHRIDELNEGIKKITEDNKAIYQLATSVEVIATRMGNHRK